MLTSCSGGGRGGVFVVDEGFECYGFCSVQ